MELSVTVPASHTEFPLPQSSHPPPPLQEPADLLELGPTRQHGASLEWPQSEVVTAKATFVCPLAPPWVSTAGTLSGLAPLPLALFPPGLFDSLRLSRPLGPADSPSLWVSLSVPGSLILPHFLPCLPCLLLGPLLALASSSLLPPSLPRDRGLQEAGAASCSRLPGVAGL